MNTLAIIEAFKALPDPRRGAGRRHDQVAVGWVDAGNPATSSLISTITSAIAQAKIEGHN